MASELLRTQLPQPWNFGVTRDGRVFFINEESRSTTWLHPVYNHPVQSGNLSRQDLPKGWEQSFTPEGVPYYIDHTSLRTSFIHPITGQSALPVHDNNQGPGQNNQKQDHFKRASLRRKSNKQKVIDKLPVAKRSENSPVTHQGWLYKQDSGGLKGWKRRWFVLSDFCLFYYKSQLDTQTQGSVLLPSYKIDYCSREDGVNKKFSFKAEHQNMRTYYFAAESKQEQDAWMSCLSSATVLQQRAASGPGPDQVFPEDQDHGGFQVNPPAPYNTADNRISGGDPRSDPRFDPRADPRSNPGGPGQGYEPGNDTGGFGDSETPRYLPNEQNTPQGYDPRMNANPQMQPVMRNSYERPRSVPPVENRYSGQEWGNPRDSDPRFDPRFRDSYRGGDQDSLSSRGSNNMRPNRDYNYNVPEDRKPGPSYLGVASNGYNPQQDSSTLEQSNDDSMEKTLDRSFDSTQPIPGYDSFQQQRSLTGQYQVQDPQPGQYQAQNPQPGQYQARDSQQRPLSGQYQIQDPQPGQYQAQNPQQRPLSGQYQVQNPQQRPLSGQYQVEEPQLNRSVPSREASMSDMGRSDSLRHLQEWKNQQMRNPQRTPSGSTSPRDQPISDGRRQYTSSASSPRDGSSERSSSRNMPLAQSSLPRQGTTHRSPPPDPLKLDGFQQSGSSGSPDPAPNRPPIPAAYREQYIRELAETKTPHSRNDLLSSIDIQRQRQEEPLVFRYPEVSPPGNPPGPPPSQTYPQDERRQKAVPPRKEFPGEDTYDSRRADTNLQPPRIDPSKSWDDLNSLDVEDAQERFRYDSRIDLLMAEKKRIAGPITEPNRMAPVLEQKPKQWQEPKPSVNRQVFNQDQRQLQKNPYQSQTSYSSVFGQEVERRDMVDARRNFMPGEADSSRSDSFRIMPAEDPNKSVRRSLESDFMNKGRQHQNEPPSNPRTNQQNDIYAVPKPRNMSQTPASRNSWQDAADHHGMGFPPYGPPSSVTQSYRDVRRVKQAPVSSTPRSPTEGFREQEDRLSRSLGNLHVDVGDWSPNPAGYPNQYPEKRGGDARGHEVPLLGRLSSSEGQLLDDHSQPLDNRPASQGPLAGRGSPKPMQNSGAPRYASPGPQPGPPKPGRGRNIETIKEDPNMSDQDILTTKTLAELEQHLSGHRMRLSIAATDLVGKTHEEIVLLLIQLRRDQSKLERTKDFYRSKLDVGRPQEKDYKLKRKNSIGRLHEVVEREHDVYAELRKMYDELENQLEVTKPLVNLLDNMVRMGSLYGGDNMMLASQYKRHKILPEQYTPPKKMILFSRQHQEEKLSKEQEEELKQLMEDEVDLEEKLQQLYQLDRELQERSLAATNLQQSKDLLEKSVTQLRKDLLSTEDPRNLQRMKHQLRLLEAELLTVRQQLAETSRLLEETSAEDAKVENEVILLRKKIYGIGRSQSSPTMGNENIRARQQLEQELHGVQSVMEGLSKQGAALSDTIKALRHSTPDLTSSGTEKNNKTYLETDMDSGQSRDLAKEPSKGASPYTSVTQQSQVTKTERIQRTSEMYSRDRSKSEPPKVEEKIQRQSMPYTFQQRDASMVSQHASINSGSAANQWGPSQNGQGPGSDRNSLGSSQRRFEPEAGPNQSWGSSQERIGSARDPRGPSPHGSITRDQVPPGAENRSNQQYQQRVVEVQRSYQIQNGANSPSSSSSLDQQPNTYRPTGAPQTSQAHQEGVYHAEMRMVTPEPRDQYRYDYRGPRPGDLGSPSDSQNPEYDQRSASQQVGSTVEIIRTAKVATGDGDGPFISQSRSSSSSSSSDIGRRSLGFDVVGEVHGDGNVVKSVDVSFSREREGLVLLHESNPSTVPSMSSKHVTSSTVTKHLITGSTSSQHHSFDSTNQAKTPTISENVGADIPSPKSKLLNQHATKLLTENEQKKKLISQSVQRTDSRSKRLTSNLALNLIEGKEEVIRDALKRVASDASDISIRSYLLARKKEQEKSAAETGSITEHQEVDIEDDAIALAKVLKTGEDKRNIMSDFELYLREQHRIASLPSLTKPTNTVEVAQALSVNGSGSTPMSSYAKDLLEHGAAHAFTANAEHMLPSSNTSSFLDLTDRGAALTNPHVGADSSVHQHQDSSVHLHRDHQGQGCRSSGRQSSHVVLQEKTFIKKHPDLAYSGKPTSEVKPQQQYRVQHVSMSSDMKTKDMEEANSYTPMELSEAEDNMKKFYGLIPKDAARTQTVRDVKKKENERRSRERKRFYVNVHGPADMEEAEEFDNNYGFQRSQSLPRRVSAPVYAAKKQSQDDSMSKRKSVGVYQAKKSIAESRASASERLFPKVSPSVSTEPQPGRIKSQEHVRRISDIFTPRPFGGSSNSGGSPWKRDEESKFGSSTSKLTSSATVATVRPVVNTNRGVDMTVTHAISTGSKSYTSNTAPSSTNGEVEIIRENARGKKYWEERLKQRHTPRGRFMTISSAQPTELEKEHVWKPSKLSSAAGDLISGLYVPDKVDIPERYIASDDEETEEEKRHRSDKGEQIKRMLAAQSLAEWKQEEVGMNRRGDSGLLHAHVQAERQRREQLLDLKQALAREVTQKSKQVAGMNQQQYSRGNEGPGRGQSAGGSLSPTYTSHTVIGSLSPPPDERGMMGYSSSRRIRTISR